MNKAEEIAEMFGNDGQNSLARGEYLSETRTLTEICDLQCLRMEKARESYAGDGFSVDYEVCYDGDLIRYEFYDHSAIVMNGVAWDIEGDHKFSFSGYNSQ